MANDSEERSLYSALTGAPTHASRLSLRSNASRASLGARSFSRSFSRNSRATLRSAGGEEVLNPYVVADTAMEVVVKERDNEKDTFVRQLWGFYRKPLGMQLVLAILNHARPRGWTNRVANKNGVEEKLGVAYARIVLACSKFERSDQDREFFEVLYSYMEAILKIILPRPQWAAKIQEMHELVRGQAENPNGVDHVNREQLRPLQLAATAFNEPFPKLHCIARFGPSLTRKDVVATISNNIRKTAKARKGVMRRLRAKLKLREREKENLREKFSNTSGASRLYQMLWGRSPLVCKVLPEFRESVQTSPLPERDEELDQMDPYSGMISGFSSPKRSRVAKDVDEGDYEYDLECIKTAPPMYPQDLLVHQRVHSSFRRILRERRKLHGQVAGQQSYIPTSLLVSSSTVQEHLSDGVFQEDDFTERIGEDNGLGYMDPKLLAALRNWRGEVQTHT